MTDLSLKRCTTCNAAHSNTEPRCDHCEKHDISLEDFENWAYECDMLRDSAAEAESGAA